MFSGETSFSIGLDDVTDRGVTVDRNEFDVDGLVFDRGEALDRRVRVEDVDRVEAVVIIEESTISETAGVDVQIDPGSAAAAGVTVELTVPGVGSASIPIPSSSYLPCASALVLAQDRIELSCTTDELPPLGNEALGRVTP